MNRPLKIGVQLPEVEYRYTWPELREIALTAESIGLDSIWYGDHLMYRDESAAGPRGPFECWSTLAALAAVTNTVTIGPLVASALFHSPAMLAKKAATLDQISGGRFVLGIGAGWHEPEYLGFGFPFDHRVSRFEEAFLAIRELFATGHATFDGEYVHLEQCDLHPEPVRPGGPPIMVGSVGERMLRRTLPHVQMWNAWSEDYGNTIDGLKTLLARVDAICDEVGRDPATLTKTVCPMVHMDGGTGRPSAYGTPPMIDGTDPARLADELATYAGLGIGHVMLVLDPITRDSVESLDAMLTALQ